MDAREIGEFVNFTIGHKLVVERSEPCIIGGVQGFHGECVSPIEEEGVPIIE
jgi:hypothetical protein